MPASASPKAPACKWTEEAEAILDEAGASEMVRAIAVLETSPTVSVETLACLGMGTTSGVALRECTNGTEAKSARVEIATALFEIDKLALVRAYSTKKIAAGGKDEAIAVMGRKCISLVQRAIRVADGVGDAQTAQTVVVQSKDDDKEGEKRGGPRVTVRCRRARVD